MKKDLIINITLTTNIAHNKTTITDKEFLWIYIVGTKKFDIMYICNYSINKKKKKNDKHYY